jgi:hypothetical protein
MRVAVGCPHLRWMRLAWKVRLLSARQGGSWGRCGCGTAPRGCRCARPSSRPCGSVLLASTGRVVTTERLVDELWGCSRRHPRWSRSRATYGGVRTPCGGWKALHRAGPALGRGGAFPAGLELWRGTAYKRVPGTAIVAEELPGLSEDDWVPWRNESGPTSRCLLLCSEGLSDLVDLDIVEEPLNRAGSPSQAVKSRWAVAMNASGVDNITIVLIEPGQVSIWAGRVSHRASNSLACSV